MSEPRRYESVLKRGDSEMSTSIAAFEAFTLLNEATKAEFRGYGDTKTAARDRAAEKAGVTPVQAERLWKNWRTQKHANAEVYRLLRNKYGNIYGHLCSWVENKADALEARRVGRTGNAVVERAEEAREGNNPGHL